MNSPLIQNLRQDLQSLIDEKTKTDYGRYFKESVKFYGIKTNVVGDVAKKYFEMMKELSKEETFALCEELLKSDYCEESFIAFSWVYKKRNEFVKEDIETFERWILEYVNNWAKCDTFCNHTVGEFVEKYPELLSRLLKWTQSENRWLRRASAVTLVLPARNGKFLPEIFKIADVLLLDKDVIVQKGYGWMLKEASKAHLEEVYEFVVKRKAVMPRTALRYAIEKMPENMRKEAMKKD